MDHYNEYEHINCGSGSEITIKDLATAVGKAVDYKGELVFDTIKPDGTPRKLMDSSRMFALGWKPKIELTDGILSSYEWFLDNEVEARPMAQAS
jgi:GDP-L-fucose synthase